MNDELRQQILDLAHEAGVIGRPEPATESVLGDVYYQELVREATLRMKRLAVGYERLRAAAVPLREALDHDLR